MGLKSGIFKPNGSLMSAPTGGLRYSFRPKAAYNTQANISGEEQAFMQQQQPDTEFGIADARRVLGEVFAPWVQDLNLSVEGFDFTPGGSADWQPGAILRMPFSERLCRVGGIVCGQALMAFADTSMVLANLAANRSFRPMTTVDQHRQRGGSGARQVRAGRA